MGEIIPIPLGPASDPARSKAAGDAVIINGFIEPSEAGKEQYTIYGVPGIASWSTVGDTSSIRGMFVLNSTLHVIADGNLYSVDGSGTETSIGTISGTQPVIIAINDRSTAQAVICADDEVFYLESGGVNEITDADLPSGVHSVDFMDGYIIFGIDDGRFFISALNDVTNIDALDFAEAEGSRDRGIRVKVFGLELWYFGEETTEVWVNTGNADFPFERLAGSFMTVGCCSKYTPAAFDNTMVWVTNKALVVRSESYVPRRISTHAVERDIQRALNNGQGSTLEAIVYSEGGHEFYQLTGPDFTWVYDAATQLWHKRVSHDEQIGRQGTRSRITQYARCYDKHIVGDLLTGDLGYLSFDTYDEFGDALILTIQSPTMHAGAQRVCWHAVYLDMEMGVGLNVASTADNYNPEVMLSWSDDGGKTYSAPRQRPLGVLGNYKSEITFNRLGQSKRAGRVWKLAVSAAVKKVVMAASADMEVLSA
jgi:hypothetical protein